MKKYILVGQGLAAYVIAHKLQSKNIEFTMIGKPGLSNSSLVAAGIWNPIVFKRLTKSWMAEQLLFSLENFYKDCEEKLKTKLVTRRKLIRPFSEEQEIKLWLKKAKNEMAEFLSQEVFSEDKAKYLNCPMPLGFGEVLGAGSLDIKTFIDESRKYFGNNVKEELFVYQDLIINKEKLRYHELETDGIIFCEGHLIKENPFFNYIPMKPVKGEVLDVRFSELQFKNAIISKGGFLMDTLNGEYKAGSTFNWEELNDRPSEKGKEEIEKKIRQITEREFTIIQHKAGIRPSVIDRRPVMGVHPEFNALYVFNGLGTKGVMLAPFLADNFVNFMLNSEALNSETNVSRFKQLYIKK